MPSTRSTILRALLVAVGLLATAACNDAPPTSTGSSESGDTSTSSGPSPSSSGHDSTAADATSSTGSTGSGSSTVDTGSTGSGSTSDASTGSTSTDTDSTGSGSSSGSSDTGSTGSGSTSGSTDTGSTGGDMGFCAFTCMDVADCFPPGGNAADWVCDGFCRFVGMLPPCDPVGCPAEAGFACDFVDGLSQCVIPCVVGGNECDPYDLECTGVTDMGGSICQSPPCGGAAEGAPCFIPGFGQFGTCTDGLCTCVDDTECTGAGLACNN